jgi:RHS repeat-associated protein
LYVTATTESGAQYADAKFVAFAGARASVDLGQQVPGDTALYWMGSLVAEQQDASGLLYRRHRYYDPASGRFTQPDPIGIAGGLNSYAYANGDPVNNRDPFGLCPKDVGGDGKSERLDDCEKGTSGYYAYTVAEGEGTVVNTVLGLGASCGESAYCEGAAIALAATTVGMVAGAGEALGLNQYLRAGMRTFRGQREFRISGRILDWLTRKEGTHWTSAKVLEAIKNLIK